LTNRRPTTDRRTDDEPSNDTPSWGLARELWYCDDPETALDRWNERIADRDVGRQGGHE
jgi:hypothetical protein